MTEGLLSWQVGESWRTHALHARTVSSVMDLGKFCMICPANKSSKMPLIRASLGAQLVKKPIAKARDVGLIPGPGRFTCQTAAKLGQKTLGPEAQALKQEKPLQ